MKALLFQLCGCGCGCVWMCGFGGGGVSPYCFAVCLFHLNCLADLPVFPLSIYIFSLLVVVWVLVDFRSFPVSWYY